MRKRTKPATEPLGLFRSTHQSENLPRVIDPKVVPLLVRLFHQYVERKAGRPINWSAVMSDKIRPHHLERKAVLYIRQSSAHQALQNLESQKLQYAMQKHLHQLGWREVEIVEI